MHKRGKENLKKPPGGPAGGAPETVAELDRAKRLSDIGMLAATVAHELRNPLATIGMAASNIKRKAKDPALVKHLVNIEKKVAESNQIINNLLFYSRLKPPHFQKVSLHDILMEAAIAAARTHPGSAELSLETCGLKGIYLVADPLQLREVANNLLNNAYDAVLPRGGKVTVAGGSDGEFVEFVVRDTGLGVDKEILPKVFDPFFTTKAKGTGLGLSVCRQIADFHGGSIEMNSVQGKGAAVTVRLPIGRRTNA